MISFAHVRRSLGALVLLGTLAAHARAGTVTLSLSEGERVADTVTITARVQGFEDAGVRQVVFYINGRERGTDSSIPYTLEWDTLDDGDGQYKIEAAATAMDGITVRTAVTVVVDNELNKGAEHHARIALEAMRANDRDRAMRHARRAVKVDASNLTAARALASLHRAAKQYDRAIAVLEQAVIPEDNIEARLELAALYVWRGDAAETVEGLIMGAQTAMEQYRKAVQARLASLGADATAERKGDAAFAARDWTGAVRAYQTVGDPATAALGSVNRLLLAYARAGRRRDCELLLRTLARENRGDDITRAVQAYYLLTTHKPKDARALVQAGAENRVYASLLIAAVADLILGERKRATEEIAALADIRPGAPEALLLQSLVSREPLDIRAQIIGAIAAAPGSPEVYVRKAQDLLTSNRPRRMEDAEAMLELARKADPDSLDALMVSAALFMVQNKAQEAEPMLKRVLELDPDAPDALVGMALTCSMLDRTREITDLLNRAMKVSDELWNDVFVPKPLDFLTRVLKYRLPVMMTPEVLYPADAG